MAGALQMLLGAGVAPGLINSAMPSGSIVGTANYDFGDDGTYSVSGVAPGNWVTPAVADVAFLYDVKVDPTSGGFATGTTGTWLNMGSPNNFTQDAGFSVTFTISFRESATTIVRSVQTGVILTGI